MTSKEFKEILQKTLARLHSPEGIKEFKEARERALFLQDLMDQVKFRAKKDAYDGLAEIYMACNDERPFEIQTRLRKILKNLDEELKDHHHSLKKTHSQMIYKLKKEHVNWKKISKIFEEHEILIIQFKLTMKDFYGAFDGEDWKIAIAQLIENLTNPDSCFNNN